MTVVDVTWHGSEVLTLTYRTADGSVAEVKKTKRRLLAERVRPHTRHFLLLTATPHNGKEEDFELFMSDHAAADGFSDDTVRTISENAKTLRFKDFSWERE